jgi:hypothetical protein
MIQPRIMQEKRIYFITLWSLVLILLLVARIPIPSSSVYGVQAALLEKIEVNV